MHGDFFLGSFCFANKFMMPVTALHQLIFTNNQNYISICSSGLTMAALALLNNHLNIVPDTFIHAFFMFQQPLFSCNSTGIAYQAPISPNYPLAWYNYAYRILAVCISNCSCCCFLAYHDCQFSSYYLQNTNREL